MEINRKEVEKIAHMARLKLGEQEINEYMTNMVNILDLAAQLNEVDTNNTPPMAHPLEEATQVLRPDIITEIVDPQLFQAIAPQVENGYYLVPKVIEGRENLDDDTLND